MVPVVVGGARGDAESLGRFLDGHADELTRLHEFGFGLVLGGEFVERLVHGEQLVVVARGGKLRRLKINALLPTPMTHRALVASPVNEDATHRLGCGSEEASLVLEYRVIGAHQTHPCLVNQGCGLESHSRTLPFQEPVRMG
jgi:hypothetical protein